MPVPAENLNSGYLWDGTNSAGMTLYYSFWQSLPAYYAPTDPEANQFRPFTPLMREAALKALALIESFTKIDFVETSIVSQAQIGFGQSGLDPNAAAWAYFPGTDPKSGDVWSSHLFVRDEDLSQGEYAFYTILHEIGHALGLQHTSTAGFEGEYNTERYSVMAYDWSPWNDVYAESYMLYDIYALQKIYGANTSYNAGNNAYVLQAGHAYTLWDGGGIDTLDGVDQAQNITVSLAAGTFSSVGLFQNIAIAYDTVIENAVGGSGNDIFYGNVANNILTGNNGNDTFHTDAGNDTLSGGFGDDTAVYDTDIGNFFFRFVSAAMVIIEDMVGSLGTDSLLNIENFSFRGQNYTRSALEAYAGVSGAQTILIRADFQGQPEQTITSRTVETVTIGGVIQLQRTAVDLGLTLLQDGGLNNIRVDGSPEKDVITLNGTASVQTGVFITGGAGDDSLTVAGMNSNDEIFGDGGKDSVSGGDGDDRIFGGDGDDVLYGDAGRDRLNGDAGNDILRGAAGDDLLIGGDGADNLSGDADNDELYGLFDDDTLSGGDGVDLLYGGNGNDSLLGGAGDDVLEGEVDNDTLQADAGDDLLYASYGHDMLRGGDGDDVLQAGPGVDVLQGGNGQDYLYGHDENDTLEGQDGDDFLYGGRGSDLLTGGLGADYLTGNEGSDVFALFDAVSIDRIQDFQLSGAEKDKIDLSNILSGLNINSGTVDDFILLEYVNSGRSDLKVNLDGQGSDFVTLATIKGSDLAGVDAQDLFDNGQLIVEKSLIL